MVYASYILVPNPEGVETFMNLTALPNNSDYSAEGILSFDGKTYTMFVPPEFRYGNGLITFDNNDFGGNENPSFGIEGTYYYLDTLFPDVTLWSTGWDGMFINGEWVTQINAVAGKSGATNVGGTAPIPSYIAESGLTLFHNHIPFPNYWYNPYAWYFSIGWSYTYKQSHLAYVQLSEGQSKDTINGLNYALNWEQP